MNTKDGIWMSVCLLAVCLFAAGGYILGKQLIHNQAVNDCLRTSVYRAQKTDGVIVTTTEEPMKSAVETCLQLKQL